MEAPRALNSSGDARGEHHPTMLSLAVFSRDTCRCRCCYCRFSCFCPLPYSDTKLSGVLSDNPAVPLHQQRFVLSSAPPLSLSLEISLRPTAPALFSFAQHVPPTSAQQKERCALANDEVTGGRVRWASAWGWGGWGVFPVDGG